MGSRIAILGALLLLASPNAARSQSSDYEAIELVVPGGDATAGREAFADLTCLTCHRVSGESMLAPVSDTPGPELGGMQAERTPGELASSIVAPSHVITRDLSDEVKRRLEGSLSPMGDYGHVMTVRQLIDIVAYLRSVPGVTRLL